MVIDLRLRNELLEFLRDIITRKACTYETLDRSLDLCSKLLCEDVYVKDVHIPYEAASGWKCAILKKERDGSTASHDIILEVKESKGITLAEAKHI